MKYIPSTLVKKDTSKGTSDVFSSNNIRQRRMKYLLNLIDTSKVLQDTLKTYLDTSRYFKNYLILIRYFKGSSRYVNNLSRYFKILQKLFNFD